MSDGWRTHSDARMHSDARRMFYNWICSARDLALTILLFGGAQILLSLLLWPALFRSHPQGFSMALSLVGFGGWFVGFASSIGARRAMARQATARQPGAAEQAATETPEAALPLADRLKGQVQRSGCGTVLFLSSLLPLALAFVLRVQADMRSGKTWNDIFPSMP
jgi:hypothetical protein